MVWDAHEERWQRGIAAARAYRETHGHLRVPPTFVTADGFRLGSWVKARRRQRQKDALSAERIAELDALDMVWDPWREGLAKWS